MADYEYLDGGRDDGCIIGRSAGKVGFYGTTPVVQGSVSSSTITTAAITTTTNNYGFANTTQLTDLCTIVDEIRTVLTNNGLAA